MQGVEEQVAKIRQQALHNSGIMTHALILQSQLDETGGVLTQLVGNQSADNPRKPLSQNPYIANLTEVSRPLMASLRSLAAVATQLRRPETGPAEDAPPAALPLRQALIEQLQEVHDRAGHARTHVDPRAAQYISTQFEKVQHATSAMIGLLQNQAIAEQYDALQLALPDSPAEQANARRAQSIMQRVQRLPQAAQNGTATSDGIAAAVDWSAAAQSPALDGSSGGRTRGADSRTTAADVLNKFFRR